MSNRELKIWRRSLVGLLALVGLAAEAVAGPIYESTNLVTGTSMNLTEIVLPSQGTLTVTMKDVQWPALLSTLSFNLVSPSGVIGSNSMNGATEKVWQFGINAPTTLYASIFAAPAVAMAGMYSVKLDFTAGPPVPLPAAGWMLISGIAGLLAFGPRQKLSHKSG